MKRGLMWIWLAVTLLLLLAPIALASENFEVKITPIKDSILSIEEAEFEVSVTNNQPSQDTFRLIISTSSWNAKSEPLHDYFGGMDIPAGQTKSTKLILSPAEQVFYGKNLVKLVVESKALGERQEQYLTVTVGSVHALKEYLAAVKKIVDLPQKVDPRQLLIIKINLENKNPKNITDMKIELKSSLINKELMTDLEPLQKKTITVEVRLDPLTPPQDDVLKVTLIIENKTLEPIKEQFEIMGYSTIVEGKESVRESFLKTVQVTNYFNDGNTQKKWVVEQKTGILKQFFTKTTPEAFVVNKDGGKYLRWELILEPQQTATVVVEENYRTLFAIIVIIIIAFIFYLLLKSPVSVRKEAIIVKTNEGGISELKILLHIKNNSSKPYNKLVVVDRIPSIADVVKETELGTIKPTEVFKHKKQGVVIKWNIGTLEKYEERIISYRIMSKLSIIGGFLLPNAIIKFVNEHGKEQTSRSNKVRISS